MTTIRLDGGTALLIDAADALSVDTRFAARTALLEARCQNRPCAARVMLSGLAPLTQLQIVAICELLQYVDLLITDRASAAQLGVACTSSHPDPAAALARKLCKRFAFGGVALPDEGYARLDTPAAECLLVALGDLNFVQKGD